MNKVSQKDPHMHARIMDLVQAGVAPEMIARTLDSELQTKRLEEEEGPATKEEFPDEILLISQALAFRQPSIEDASIICRLLNEAYKDEILGPEAFREEQPLVTEESILAMLEGQKAASFRWLCVEAPDGRGVEEDGAMLGVCCFTTDGVSKCNGEVEGHLGSIRYLGVMRKYRGVLIGQRLLSRVEKAMLTSGCMRSMVCVPSTRETMMDWLERRDYTWAGGMPYPAQGLLQTLLSDKADTELVRFLKKLTADGAKGTRDKPPLALKLNTPGQREGEEESDTTSSTTSLEATSTKTEPGKPVHAAKLPLERLVERNEG